MSSIVRDRCLPRKLGIAQKPHAVAALGDLHVRPRRGRLGAREEQQVHRRRGFAPERHRHRVGEPRNRVDFRNRVAHLIAVALGQAPRHDETRPVFACIGQGENRVDRLLARRLDERTRVDDHDVGVGRCACRYEPVGQERTDQLLGINLVLRAAQRLYPEAVRHPNRLREIGNADEGQAVR